MSKKTFDYDVAIIGYGPSGVTAANFLGNFGVRTLVIERDRDIYSRARAVTVDGQTIRQFQAVGLDAALKADMDVTTALRWKTYAGHEFLRSQLPADNNGHDASYMIFQPRLEATLREGVERFSEVIDVHFGEEFQSLEQDDEGVTVTTTNVETSAASSYRVKYAIGADGGSSLVRRALGIDLTGLTKARVWIVIDAKVKRWWPERELLTFWSDPVRPVVDIPLALDHHRWEIPLGPEEKKEDFDSEEAVWKLLAPLGITPDHVELIDHAFYSHHLRQANEWHKGRVFLAGDSAHMMPPWAGQGMQSGMRDGANLAWKLAAILNRGVSDDLLATYQPERQPNVTDLTNLSVGLGKLIEVEAGPKRFVRDRILPIMSKLPGPGPSGVQVSPDLRAGFITGVPSKSNALGRLIPQPHVATQTGHRVLFDSLLGTDFAVVGVGVDPRTVLSPAQTEAWVRFGSRFITLRSCNATPRGDSDIVDFENVLVPWLKKYSAHVVVVRPDRFIAATDSTGLDVPEFSSAGQAAPSRALAQVG